MGGARSGSSGLVVVAVLLGVVSGATHAAAAGGSVSIEYDPALHAELVARLSSELATEGYAVELHPEPQPTPCDANAALPAPPVVVPRAWIRLTDAADGSDTVLASICYLGTLPLVLTATPSAPRAEPQRLAVATAEALNGLRSKVPPGAATEVEKPRALPPPPVRLPSPEPPVAPRTAPGSSLAVGATIFANAPGLSVAPGASLDVGLGIASWLGVHVSGLVPFAAAEVESPAVTASVRTAWLRVGPRAGGALGDFELSGALLAGPAVTWATAVARKPRVGTADVSPGAVVSFAGMLEYPRASVLFARASVSASALLPAVRVELWSNEARPRGAWPLEGTLGLGARFGR